MLTSEDWTRMQDAYFLLLRFTWIECQRFIKVSCTAVRFCKNSEQLNVSYSIIFITRFVLLPFHQIRLSLIVGHYGAMVMYHIFWQTDRNATHILSRDGLKNPLKILQWDSLTSTFFLIYLLSCIRIMDVLKCKTQFDYAPHYKNWSIINF